MTLANTQSGQRGSMILYRLAAVDDMGTLTPPRNTWHRDSIASASDQSLFSLSSDSKYPSGIFAHSRGLVPYAYDPDTDNVPEEDDHLHEPDLKDKNEGVGCWTGRGWLNIGALALLISALLSLFICYPVVSYYQMNSRNRRLLSANSVTDGNNSETLNTEVALKTRDMIDNDTPEDVKTRTGWDGEDYVLVFSDEFNTDGRTFYPGDDPFWEAVDLQYWVTKDLEWYDPGQVTTRNGALRIKIENKETNNLQYKSGMLQSWNKFCFTSGYLEVAVTFPGPNSNTQGYVRSPLRSFSAFLITTYSGPVYGLWVTLGDPVMLRPPMDCGPTRKPFFVQFSPSDVDFLPGTIHATLARFPTRPYLITPVPPLPCDQKRRGLYTTTSCRGFLDNGCRALIDPFGQ